LSWRIGLTVETSGLKRPMKSKPETPAFVLPITTAEGTFLAHYTNQGLAGLDFPNDSNPKMSGPKEIPSQVQAWHRATTRALTQPLPGRDPRALPPLDLSRGTDFQQRVWAALRRIGAGRTQSYAEVARAIGRPGAVRAVGGACGANPIPVLVPCHRVLAAKQKLGGFSAGLDW